MIFSPTAADRDLFNSQFRDFLPDRIVDCHSHLICPGMLHRPTAERLKRYWMLNMPTTQTVEEYLETYKLLLPGKQVTTVAFGFPVLEADLERQNAFVLESSRKYPQISHFLSPGPTIPKKNLSRPCSKGFSASNPILISSRAIIPAKS
jgi:hypothetical protein